jgi:hypothetical protein
MNPSGVGMRRLQVGGTTANQEVVLEVFSTIQSPWYLLAFFLFIQLLCSALLLGHEGEHNFKIKWRNLFVYILVVRKT